MSKRRRATRPTRGIWTSVIIVVALALGSLTALITGALQPTLGLDLEGGVSVILSAPPGTPKDVMNQALENIRNRVDAFGVGEPSIVVSGTNIEIQIPGLAQGTIEQRQADRYCLAGPKNTNYGCADDEASAQEALKSLTVHITPPTYCLRDQDGNDVRCFNSLKDVKRAKKDIQVMPTPKETQSESPTPSPSGQGPVSEPVEYCLVGPPPESPSFGCYPTEQEANDALENLKADQAPPQYCVVTQGLADSADAEADTDASATPTPKPDASASASPSPTPEPDPYDSLNLDGSVDLRQSPPCFPAEAKANAELRNISVEHETQEYCVISSAGEDLGCFFTQQAAEVKLRETGQERLLSVIGETARLEERPVLEIIDQSSPNFASTPLTCGTEEERTTKECTPEALRDVEVVYSGGEGVKYRLGPTVITGSDIKSASAQISPQGVQQWVVAFELHGDGAKAFGDATTALQGMPPPQNQLAIILDREVISAPTVNSAITDGKGEISGGFTQEDAKDFATQLNSGALPVELTRQSVQTVSPTLGKESLREGIIAGVVGLVLLFLYLLFYYRLLGVVAWFGMTIWAILALALVSIAGTQVGYALTLAGVAGLVISLGVTADSYIVFFERLKDEVRGGRSPGAAVEPAFKKAFRTILAADVVTAIAAIVLYITAVSSVRGFALTLGVSTLLDLFVVYFFKRPTVILLARSERLVQMHGFGLTSGVAAEEFPSDAAPEEGSA